MHQGPDDPRQPAGELQALHVCHGPAAPDHGEVALVAVPERPRGGPAVQTSRDHAGDVRPFLKRSLGDAGHGLDVGHVADHEHLRPARQRQIGREQQAPGAVELGAALGREPPPQRRGGDAGRPDHGVRCDPRPAIGVLHGDACGVDADCAGGEADVDAHAPQLGGRRPLQPLGEGRQHEPHGGALMGLALRADLSAVGLDQAPGDGQAEPRTARVGRLDESVEDVRQGLGRDAGSGVLDREHDTP